MLGLPLAFTAPLVLAALAALPVLFVLLRVTPPRPERVPFPPLKLIMDLRPREETPAKTPWWLLLLRVLAVAAVILAMAGPIWNPVGPVAGGKGPLLVMIDDGWGAAPTWDQRMAAAVQRIEGGRRNGEAIAVIAASDGGKTIIPGDAAGALERLRAIKPQPFTPDRAPVADALAHAAAAFPGASLVWIAETLDRGGLRAFADRLVDTRLPVTLVADPAPVLALNDPRNDGDTLVVRVMRSHPGEPARGQVRAIDGKGLTIGEAGFSFGAQIAVDARFDLPLELRNEIARLDITGNRSAGSVALLDARWRRRSVGIVSGDTADTDQPLLAPNYYLRKALARFADVHEPKPGEPNPIGAMLDDGVNVLILADVGTITGPIRDRLSHWVDDGGLLVRFAGTRLSAADDPLVPVTLRHGGRVLGGSLSWEQPRSLAAFEPPSPFVGLKIPKEVLISRQVLAEPEPGLPAKTWAQLADGTPLVTAAGRGKGRVVLFHVTANTTWSNLPLSGLFIDMLKRIVALAGENTRAAEAHDRIGKADSAEGARPAEELAPNRILDGFGAFGSPPATAKPVALSFSGASSAAHPAGFYGTGDAVLAVNALLPDERIAEADLSGYSFQKASLQAAAPLDLRPWLVGLALILFALDSVALLWLGGKFRGAGPRRAVMGAALIGAIALVGALPRPAQAQPAQPNTAAPQATQSTAPEPPIKISPSDLASALTVRLAYVVSGDSKTDEISRQGLTSLSTTLAARTSLTPGDPIGLDPSRDELAFYPLIYWPVVANAPQPSAATVAKISAYMRQGGTVVFDTRDALAARRGEPTPESAWLRQLLKGVDVPELEPVPADHVVTKTFYLLDGFIGRYASGQTWIEALPPPIGAHEDHPARAGDDVSPIVLTSNDLAAGWAGDEYGEALYPLVPGDPRQHELALRGGINLVMYTLTGNYKADQVHVRDLLERLGH